MPVVYLESRPGGGEQIGAGGGETGRDRLRGGEACRTRAVGDDHRSVERCVLGHRVGIVGLVGSEYAEASADHGFGSGAVGEPHARAEVRIPPVGDGIAREPGGADRNHVSAVGRIEDPETVVALRPGCRFHLIANSQVQGQLGIDAPVILHINGGPVARQREKLGDIDLGTDRLSIQQVRQAIPRIRRVEGIGPHRFRRREERECGHHPVGAEFQLMPALHPTESLVDFPDVVDLLQVSITVAQSRHSGNADGRHAGAADTGVGNAILLGNIPDQGVGNVDEFQQTGKPGSELVVLRSSQGTAVAKHALPSRRESLAGISGSASHRRAQAGSRD